MKVVFISPFTLITDDHRRFEFAAGVQDIPDELADHWYVKAHLVENADTIVEPAADPVTADSPVVEKRQPGRPKKS